MLHDIGDLLKNSGRKKRVIHDIARVLDVAALARAGFFEGGEGIAIRTKLGEILGNSTPMKPVFTWITARLSGGGGVLIVRGDYSATIQVTTRPAKIPPFVHWYLICPECKAQARRLFWAGGPWQCRKCARLVYRDSCRPNSTPAANPREVDLEKLRGVFRFEVKEVLPILKAEIAKARKSQAQRERRTRKRSEYQIEMDRIQAEADRLFPGAAARRRRRTTKGTL